MAQRIGPGAGVLGAAAFAVSSLIAALVYSGTAGEGFSPLNHWVSELGEMSVSRLALLFNAGIFVGGISLGDLHDFARLAASQPAGVALRARRHSGRRRRCVRGHLPDGQRGPARPGRLDLLRPGLDLRRPRIDRHLAPPDPRFPALAAVARRAHGRCVPGLPVALRPIPDIHREPARQIVRRSSW